MSYFTNTSTVFVLTERIDFRGVKTYSYWDFTNAGIEAVRTFLYWATGHKIIGVSNQGCKRRHESPIDYYEWCPAVNEETGEDEWGWHTYDPHTEAYVSNKY
jgi:hypothetical protein